ncbi:WD40 repeat-like protein [Suillus clintonianus]|uniref:WD40 repeat-like protein n=1 Tax=Suillus clintonianus TaxID=1904413 RepID=UPI001B85F73E|nr:WD40 repeat-like protein [Suillus clintonianus]KAG2134111.1 WD40 repeat-like protein [Suillus clintonianus]
MPDSFFSSTKNRKRKRSVSTAEGARGAKKILRKGKSSSQDSKLINSSTRGVRRAADEELNSDRTDSEDGGIDDIELRADVEPETSGDEDEQETPAEKRLRLAKLYLESVKDGLADGEFDAAEIDRELISERLRQDVLEHSGKVHLFVADLYDFTSTSSLRCRGHRFSVTSAVASEDAQYLYTSGKEGTINKWCLQSGKKIATFYKQRVAKGKEKALPQDIQGHTDEILSLAVSSDGRYLASGSKDRRVGVWDVEKDEWVKGFGGHKDSVSSVAFRKGTQQLYTGSFDRTIKLFDLSVMGYVETLFGHQDTILSLDALRGETAVTAGARDRTIRFWKIADESQLVFRGGGKSAIRELLEGGAFEGHEDEEHVDGMKVDGPKSNKGKDKMKESKYAEGSIECVALIDETTFVSGGDTGSICLWNTQKKKPVYTQTLCHGFHEVQSSTEGLVRTPRWITAVASLRYSDMFVSGSWDGEVRLWKLDQKLRSFSLVGSIPAPGVVNSLQLLVLPRGALDNAPWREKEQRPPTKSPVQPALLVVGLGQEHRLGRWLSLKGEGVTNATTVHIIYPRT